MSTPDKLERAKALLTAFEEALPHCEAICDTVSDWVAGEDAPPLLRSSYSWREAVDPEKLNKFRMLLFFLGEAIFGVDCDNDSALRIILIDRARDLRRPGFAIPRISDKPTLKEILYSLQRARLDVRSSQSVVDEVERELEFFLEDNAHLLETKSE
jgi:hypothetical protein